MKKIDKSILGFIGLFILIFAVIITSGFLIIKAQIQNELTDYLNNHFMGELDYYEDLTDGIRTGDLTASDIDKILLYTEIKLWEQSVQDKIDLANKYSWLLNNKLVYYYNHLYSLNYEWLLNGL
jgi:hypothetical protein